MARHARWLTPKTGDLPGTSPHLPLDTGNNSGILAAMEPNTAEVAIQFKRRWLLGPLVGLLFLQMVAPSRAWVVVLVGLGGAVVLGYLWARQLAGKLTIAREQRYGWIHVGDLLEERFTLQNSSAFAGLYVRIEDHSDLPGYTARTVRSVSGRETIQWRTEGICRLRGLFSLGPWQATTGDPLGFFEVTVDHPESQSILVYPPVVYLPTLHLPKGAASGAGRTSRHALEVTTNAAGIRAYSPGDSLSRVHWRTTARLDSLMVKTFDLEPSGDLWIVLDLDAAVQAGVGEESTEEYGVILAASLASRTLGENRAVGLVAYGASDARSDSGAQPLPTIVMPQKGNAQQWRILQALATVRAGGAWPLKRVLAEMDRNLGRGITLAVITPSCDPGWVAELLPPMRRGVSPTVVILDPESFGGEGNVEAMIGLLADLGVSSHRIAQGMPFKPIVEHKRVGRPKYRVLPGTGRVIAVEQ
jgi:uncharacterized protein (DUF58 family)